MASGGSDAKDSRWYFTAEQLQNSPSRKCGIEASKELLYRQQTAYLIQEMGQQLRVSQLCINTAIVYMHRFYAFHSFTHFHRNGIAAASLFLAAKVEEQPRKLEHVIKVAHMCLNLEAADTSKESFAEQAQDLVFNENVLLQTLGFDVAIDHPHTHVVKTCHLVKACKDLAQTSYFMASNSLHLTTMCLQYRPTVVACFCIHLSCKWSRWEIPKSTEGKQWFHYVDKTVTMDLLKQLTDEFIHIYEESPSRLKSKLNSLKALAQAARIDDPQKPQLSTSNNQGSSHSNLESNRMSSSSHHRPHPSSSHSHHSKQAPHISSSGGDVPIKTSSSSVASSSHKPHYSQQAQQSSNRSRNPPPSSDNSSGLNMSQSTSQHKSLPPQHHGGMSSSRSSSSQRPSHTSSHDATNYPRDNKNRNSTGQTGLLTQHQHALQKSDQRSEQRYNLQKEKDNMKQMDPNKINHSKSQSTANLFGENIRVPPSSSAHIARHAQQFSFSNPAIVGNQKQQSQSSSDHSSVHNQKTSSLNNDLSFRFLDDNRDIEPMDISSPPRSGSKVPSIFSPERKETPQAQTQQHHIKVSNNDNKPISKSSNRSNTESPIMKKQHHREDRRSETPKKDKRLDRADPMTPTSQKQISNPDKKANSMKRLNETPGMSIVPRAISPYDSKSFHTSQKRSYDDMVRQDEGIDFREAKLKRSEAENEKMRKYDIMTSPKSENNFGNSIPTENLKLSQASISSSLSAPKVFPTTVNGIETNPDLVSSLLKGMLCTETKLGSSLNSLPTTPHQDNSATNVTVSNQPSELNAITESGLMSIEHKPQDTTDHHRSKSEKKKKKDKHKHKDKDKTKDKEERKKHKKDKERQKERSDNKSNTNSPPADNQQNLVLIKITIPKDKLNLSAAQDAPNPPTSGFKIKIPKDRIKTELSSSSSSTSHVNNEGKLPYGLPPNGGGNNFDSHDPKPPSSLKIKISKDMIENFHTTGHSGYTHGNEIYNAGGGGGGGGARSGGNYNQSSKKKDKDREKERDRSIKNQSKSLSNDYNKQNGNGNNSNSNNNSNGGGGGASGLGGSASGNRNTSSTSNPNKVLPPISHNNNNTTNMTHSLPHQSQLYNMQLQQQHVPLSSSYYQQQQHHNHLQHQYNHQYQQQQQQQQQQHQQHSSTTNIPSSRPSDSKLINSGNSLFYYNNSRKSSSSK